MRGGASNGGLCATAVMFTFARPISEFVSRHPTVKVLALSFLILIGAMLVGHGLDQNIPKGYIYFAMAFSVGVEMLNLRMRAKSKPVSQGPFSEVNRFPPWTCPSTMQPDNHEMDLRCGTKSGRRFDKSFQTSATPRT